jgi:hypothetical protein
MQDALVDQGTTAVVQVSHVNEGAAVVGDLLPSAFDLLYAAIGGTRAPRDVRGIVARTLLEHLHLFIQQSIASSDRPAIQSTSASEKRELNTFDRYSSNEATRDDLLARMSSRLEGQPVAELALALLELRTDLSLVHAGYLLIEGVGRIQPASDREAIARGVRETAASLCLTGPEWRRNRRDRKWFLRSVVDQLRLSVIVRPPCIYRMTLPPIVVSAPDQVTKDDSLDEDEVIAFDALFGKPE